MPEPTKQWYNYEELAVYLELPETLIRKYVNEGMLPRPVKLSERKSAYHHSELEYLVWIIARRERYGKGEEPETKES